MQVKKFEAPTMQEALEAIKRELGPEAIILQTKNHKGGFGLLSKPSVEVTAAVSDRSLGRKQFADTRMPEPTKQQVKNLPADRQADMYDKYMDRHLAKAGAMRDRVEVSRRGSAGSSAANRAPGAGAPAKRMTTTRYADIDEPPMATHHPARRAPAPAPQTPSRPQYSQQPPAASARPQAPSPSMYDDEEDDFPAVAAPVAAPAGRPSQAEELAARLSAEPQSAGAVGGTFNHQGMSLEDEVRLLKRMIEELKVGEGTDSGPSSGAQAMMGKATLSTPALQDAFEQLVIAGVDKRYAYKLIKNVAFELGADGGQAAEQVLDQLAIEVMRNTPIATPMAEPGAEAAPGPRVIALVGPTGVGKTTTVAKMASEALLKRGLKVGLINLDSYKVAAFDQLGTYAKILNVPFRSCATADDLRAAILDFQSLDLVLVDTTGRSQRDPGSLREMQGVLNGVEGIATQLVLSVTTRDAELYDMASRFAIFKPEGIIVSKLDEATLYGAIYNVSQKVKLPLLYFTTGQRVPEDIEEATRERVAALVLDLG